MHQSPHMISLKSPKASVKLQLILNRNSNVIKKLSCNRNMSQKQEIEMTTPLSYGYRNLSLLEIKIKLSDSSTTRFSILRISYNDMFLC